MAENSLAANLKRALNFLKNFSFEKKWQNRFSGLMRLKHLGVMLSTCSLIEWRLNLPLYNNSANWSTFMVSNSANFNRKVTFGLLICLRVPFKRTGNFTSAVKCQRQSGPKQDQKKWKGEKGEGGYYSLAGHPVLLLALHKS